MVYRSLWHKYYFVSFKRNIFIDAYIRFFVRSSSSSDMCVREKKDDVSMLVFALHQIYFIFKWIWLSAWAVCMCVCVCPCPCHPKPSNLNLWSILHCIYDKISASINFDFTFYEATFMIDFKSTKFCAFLIKIEIERERKNVNSCIWPNFSTQHHFFFQIFRVLFVLRQSI